MLTDAHGLVITKFGDPPHLEPLRAPELAPGQVLIAVEAASVNAFDWKAAEGRFKGSFEYEFPVTIGRDYAGVVVGVGSSVTRVRVGDAVFGYFTGQKLRRGSFATHVWVSEDECFVRVPVGLSLEAAACLPLSGVVALRCVTAVDPRPGDQVLILGAPGGVGSIAVQLAARRGAVVIASGLPEDEEYLLDLGAIAVVSPKGGVYPDGIDGLIDLVDYKPDFLERLKLLVPGGRAASVHRAVDDAALAERGLRGVNVGSFPDSSLLTELGELAAAGSLRVPVTARYPLRRAAAALADARDNHTRGKILITMR